MVRVPYPIQLQSNGLYKYFDDESAFNVKRILKSPMGIMILIFGFLFVCTKMMPKMEDLQAADNSQK